MSESVLMIESARGECCVPGKMVGMHQNSSQIHSFGPNLLKLRKKLERTGIGIETSS